MFGGGARDARRNRSKPTAKPKSKRNRMAKAKRPNVGRKLRAMLKKHGLSYEEAYPVLETAEHDCFSYGFGNLVPIFQA